MGWRDDAAVILSSLTWRLVTLLLLEEAHVSLITVLFVLSIVSSISSLKPS